MEIEGKIVKLSKFTKASLEESWNWIIGNVIDTFYWSSFAVNNHLYSDILRNFFKVSAWISSLNKPCNFYSCDLRRILKRFLLLKHFWCRFLEPLQYGWRRLEGTARPFNILGNEITCFSYTNGKCCPHLRYHITSCAPDFNVSLCFHMTKH